jgi:hypothetical protein
VLSFFLLTVELFFFPVLPHFPLDMAKTHDEAEMRAADSDSSLDGSLGTSEDAKDIVLTLGETEEFPFDFNPWSDLCYHVYLDGHLVVSTLNLEYSMDEADDL